MSFGTHGMLEFGAGMGDPLRTTPLERDVEQVITALKKGARLLKYGRRGKPKFCPFRLSVDETALIWYVGKSEKQLILNQVSKIIPGQRTICKDKEEAEVWFVGLKSLIPGGNYRKRFEPEVDRTSDANGHNTQISIKGDLSHQDPGDIEGVPVPFENQPINGTGKLLSDEAFCTAPKSSFSSGGAENSNGRSSGAENIRVSASSAVSSSSHGSCFEDFDGLSDVFIWGEVPGDGAPGDNLHKAGIPFCAKQDSHIPKQLQATFLLDVQHVSCGNKYVALVTKNGEVYSWGEESGGRLGHGVDAYVSHPKVIKSLADMNIQLVACGEYHTCAITLSGDLYTWGDGIHNSGLLGHGTEASHWIPKLVVGPLEGLPVSSVSCGPWHTAIITSGGQLFTFGDGTFGALGHGDYRSTNIPREVEAFRGLCTVRAACGVWHTAAIVEISVEITDSDNFASGRLFTWGNGDKGQLGHGDRETRLVPACVSSLTEPNFCQVACGQDITIALTTCGRVYTMGSSFYGQRGNPEADAKLPTCVEGKLRDNFVEEIACGSYHTAVLTSRTEVYTWGKGANGQLGHGDTDDRNKPTHVEALKGKHVKKIVCGPNFTAAICIHKMVSSDDLSICSGCRLPFSFRRKCHNCYNCGLAFCKSCSSKKSVKAALAPSIHKPYRVCDECYTKIKKSMASGMHSQVPKYPNGGQNQMSNDMAEKESVRSRLSSMGSFKGETKPRQIKKSEPSNNRSYPVVNERTHWESARNILVASSSISSASVPSSRMASRSASPVSSMPSPSTFDYPRSPEVIADYSKRISHSMDGEVVSLHLQVEDLRHKSELLEAELESKTKQFREATSIAEEETARSKAAKEVIKSLTAQLKDMAERVAEGYVIDANGILTEELVEQDEPGVSVTLSWNPEGEISLKRVFFSRKEFNERQAQNWWTDNRPRLQQKYNSHAGRRSPANSFSLTVRKDEMVD
ncbi:uncharacterized protein A4U43_C03F17020 [Asparagus officinalis]|uniref:FYVE-type domain-containing protein n=1 Tax=Asparagus officinalis TaxID=4686 RepID=A0A5P1FAR6_ASPOF|nr:uncharacterized protein LOC109833880 isoform X2 [Asparagus officinalis]ONK75455.1 uncharacterized protein A4U43_C03F17020 [Asparagus officinalis]